MSVSKKSVELFYDVISPYSWFAFEILTRYRSKWPIELKLKPFFLGGIMNETGNRPPGVVPAKAKYMFKDIRELADYYNVPLNMPSDPAEMMFTKGSLAAMRFITAVDMSYPEKTEMITRIMWTRVWSKDEDITTQDSMKTAGQAAGLSKTAVDDIITKSAGQDVKDRLKAYTQQALELGAFGSPTISTQVNERKDVFFGSDRFELIAHIMGEKWEGPLPELSKARL